MQNDDVKKYIHDARASGLADSEIRKILAETGWAEDTIGDSFSASGPILRPVEPSFLETMGPMEERKASFLERNKTALIAASILAVILVGGGASGGWYHYTRNILPKRAYAQMPEKMADLERFTYNVRVKIKAGSSGPQTTEEIGSPSLQEKLKETSAASILGGLIGFFDKGKGKASEAILKESLAQFDDRSPQLLPKELLGAELEIRSSGSYAKVGGKTNFSVLFDFNLSHQGQSAGLGAEFRSVGDTYYFRIVELPIEFLSAVGELTPFAPLDITSYLKNWYSLNASTLAELKFSPSSDDYDILQQEEERIKFRKLLSESDIVEIMQHKIDPSLPGKPYAFEVKIKKADFRRFLSDATKLLQDRALTKSEEISIEEFIKGLEKASIRLWITQDDHFLEKAVIVVDNFQAAGQSFQLELGAEFSDFKTASVAEPASAIPFDQELKELFQGFSNAGFGFDDSSTRSRDARRVVDLKQLQLALELHFDADGGYPASLNSIAPRFLPEIPVDPTDNKSYAYSPGRSPSERAGKFDLYHLGASLENAENRALDDDRDCNSLTGARCPTKATFDKKSAFDGSDSKGCRKEPNRFCYDVLP